MNNPLPAPTTLGDLLNKRPAQKLEKLYPGVTTKPLADLTVRDLNNIALHLMVEDGRTLNGILNPLPVALEIITSWAQDQKLPIL